MNTPLVSICSLTYNHAPYIRECLEGFLMQKTDFAFEIIINDDASTDGTTEIIREYETKYPHLIKPIYHEENKYSKGERGIVTRYCLPKAQGKYIVLCEGDDYWTDPLKLQKQVDFLEKNPAYAFCCHRFQKYYEHSASFAPEYAHDFYKEGVDLEITNKLFFKVWITQPLTTIIRADLLKAVWQESGLLYKYFRDVHLFYFLLKKGKGISLNQFMGVYRLHFGGIAGLRNPLQGSKETSMILGELWRKNRKDMVLLMYLCRAKIVYAIRHIQFKISKS